ncbi:MAG: histidine kinase [Firmicutes bacterium]|nr:histidine kinase [Bacillota bacterium]
MIGSRSRPAYSDLYRWTFTMLGTATLVLLRPAWGRLPWEFITLVALFGVAEYVPTRVKHGGIAFSLPIAYTGFLLYGTAGAIWVAAVGTALANLGRRRPWRITWFNAAQFAVAALVAGRLSLLWAGPPTVGSYILPLLAYICLYYIANNLIVDGLLWLNLKQYPMADWLAKSRFEAISAAVALAYCILMMVLAPQQRGHDPLALTFFFLPLLTVGGFVRLLTNISRFAGQLALLVDVSSLVTSTPEDLKVLDTALAYLDGLGAYQYAAIYQIEGDDLVLRALRGIPHEQLTHRRISLGEGVTGWAVKSATPVFAAGARQDLRNRIGEGVREGAPMLAAIPLISSGQVLGALTIGKDGSQTIPKEDVRLLTIFANLLASILRNLHQAGERERLLLVQERNRLAREIHDGLAQSLAGAILQMDRLERLIETEPRTARRFLQQMRDYIREVLLEVRRSIYNLRPSPLEAHGLVETLRQEIERMREKGLCDQVDLRMEVRGAQRRLSGLVEDEVFRIAQEGMANALRHAAADDVLLSLHFYPDRLRLTVRDNGKGFVLGEAIRTADGQTRFGLTGMSERAERLGAGFDVESRPGGGTRLVLDVPLLGE